MTPKEFINHYQEAFGENTQLPIAFWYSDNPVADTEKTYGCMFSRLKDARNGQPVSLWEGNMTCGSIYAGFSEMQEGVAFYVSQREHYQQTPQMVMEYVKSLEMQPMSGKYLNFVRVDSLETFDEMEGLLFFATPDMLSGLCGWTYYDNNSPDAVVSQFGSGCSSVIPVAVRENRKNGNRTFLGGFDPSARPHLAPGELTFVIPRSRWNTMKDTMLESCLFKSMAWNKIKDRISKQS